MDFKHSINLQTPKEKDKKKSTGDRFLSTGFKRTKKSFKETGGIKKRVQLIEPEPIPYPPKIIKKISTVSN